MGYAAHTGVDMGMRLDGCDGGGDALLKVDDGGGNRTMRDEIHTT